MNIVSYLLLKKLALSKKLCCILHITSNQEAADIPPLTKQTWPLSEAADRQVSPQQGTFSQSNLKSNP